MEQGNLLKNNQPDYCVIKGNQVNIPKPIMVNHIRVIFDGNMKELWDFNRSSVKSYLFFLIY